MTTTDQIAALLDRELDRYRDARDTVATLSVLHVAKLARDEYPTATHVNCDYSDQPGCGLNAKEVVLASGKIVDADDTDFADMARAPLSNLNEDCEGAWQPFFITDDDAGEEVAQDMDALLLDINRALEIEAPEAEPVVLVFGTPIEGFRIAGPFTPNDPEFERAIELHLTGDLSYWWYAPLLTAADFIAGVF